MQQPKVTVVVPTLAQDRRLLDCLASLDHQTLEGVQVVVVDNSARGSIHRLGAARFRFRLIENNSNVGFGEAINQGYRLCPAPYLATLNDDAVADPTCLARMVAALEADPRAGMCAPKILMAGRERIDSAGMLIARDGSSKQRGHGAPAREFSTPGEALLPSGCAALYRGTMLEETGLFAPEFFLYCEDTDLGLRGVWRGWTCVYEPAALVEHHYSMSAGSASARKAWFVERNRIRLGLRCLPLGWLLLAPVAACVRYLWHVVSIFNGAGKAAEFRQAGGSATDLPWIVGRAHLDALRNLGVLWNERRAIRRSRRITASQFTACLRRHSITLRQVAQL